MPDQQALKGFTLKTEDPNSVKPAMLQVVYGEVYAPNRLDAQHEFMTAEEIRLMAWRFAKNGMTQKVDVNHDNNPVAKVEIVESFIARAGDPDFLEGSWVIGVHIEDPETWQKVLDGELNGFSLEAMVTREVSEVELDFPEYLTGFTTETDGHTHTFKIKYDKEGLLVGGVTDEVDGHMHYITRGTKTDKSKGHSHGFSAVDGLEFAELAET